jgi:hypothetical protein
MGNMLPDTSWVGMFSKLRRMERNKYFSYNVLSFLIGAPPYCGEEV